MSELPDTVDLDVVRSWLSGGFHDVLAMSVVDFDQDAGVLRLALPFQDRYARLPQVGDYHGGVLSAFLDVAGTFVAALAAGGPVATMNLRIDYLRPAVKCGLVATATIVRAGRSAIVADAEVADDKGRACAIARGTWTVLKKE